MNTDRPGRRVFLDAGLLGPVPPLLGPVPPLLTGRPFREQIISPDEIINLKIDIELCKTAEDVEKLVAAR
jgi:hypothetical protein